MAVKTTKDIKPKYKTAKEPVSLESMERLAQIMLDTPTIKKLERTEFAITALKPAVEWMIAQEAVKITKVENAVMGDVLKALVNEIPSVCRIITLAILNDKERIEKDYDTVYNTLFWDCNTKEWAQLLFEILNLISIEAFFLTTDLIQTFKTIALERKTRMEEEQK